MPVASSPTSSSSSSTMTWTPSPFVVSTAVIVICLISSVVVLAVEGDNDMVLSSDVGRKIDKQYTVSSSTDGSSRSSKNSNNNNNNNHNGIKFKVTPEQYHHTDNNNNHHTDNNNNHHTDNYNDDSNSLRIHAGPSISTASENVKTTLGDTNVKSHSAEATVFSGTFPNHVENMYPDILGLGIYSNVLDNGEPGSKPIKVVNYNNHAGIYKTNNEDLGSFKINVPKIKRGHPHRRRAKDEHEHVKLRRRAKGLRSGFKTNNSNTRLKKVRRKNEKGYILTKKTAPERRDPNQRPPYRKSVEIKRFSRSVDNSAEDNFNSAPEDVLLTENLHFIAKSNFKQCKEQGDRVIIMSNSVFSPDQFFPLFAKEVNKTVQLANTISNLMLFTKSSPKVFMEVFFALTQSLVETSPQVKGCGIVIDNLSSSSISTTAIPSKPPTTASSASTSSTAKKYQQSPQALFPYSYRTNDGIVVVTDLSRMYMPQTTTWYSYHAQKSTEGLLKERTKIYANNTDVGILTSYKNRWNKTVSVTPDDGFWTQPYYDCLLENWVVQYSVPFYQLEGNTPNYKGVVLLEANIEAVEINQCADDGSLFSNTHRCIRSSTECKNIPSVGFQSDSYHCVCKEGYQFPSPNSAKNYFEGRAVESAYLEYVRNISSNYTTEFNCLPMPTPPPSSMPLSGEGEPIVAFDFLVRGIPLGIQSFCMTVSLVIGIVLICLRKTKVMRSSIWVLLEMLLFGAILLYATVVIQYFEPTTTTCLLLPWFREVGFAIVYGVLVLKIYRILAEFQSRKAHRVHVRDKDLLKYLAVILTVVLAYMSAWTAVNMDHLDNNSTILERLYTEEDGLAYTLCRSMWWDYVIEAGEFIFLCFGIYMCYCVRSAPTEYSEGRFITGAICYEAVMSTIFYVLRHMWWYQMHPDHLFLMFFLRCQLTVTVVLLIILGPKLWYAHRPPDEDHGRSRAYSQSDVQDSSSPETMKLNVGISSNGDVEVGEISLTEMDPEDIRAELKRLYTQLQIYKTKTMRKDNPHISKRRGGRKQTHRRFSLQAFHHKHRHHHDHDHEHEMSKTPEESTNSAEAMAFTIEPSVKEDPNEGRSAPSVSFKPGHK